MSAPYALYNRPLNPDFGKGVYRRRIRLQGSPGKVIAELEDCNHGFRSVLHHDGSSVTAIEPEALRTPLTTCDGALAPLHALVGTPLTRSSRDIAAAVDPKQQCTHLYDLTVLAIHHALRGEEDRQYDIAIPDEDNHPTDATASLNGRVLLRWTIENWLLLNEGELQGKSLGRGFSKWASALYQGDEREAAFALQKGYFVSNARRYDMSKLEGTPVTDSNGIACYSYSPEQMGQAVRRYHSTRDFTDCEEQLLKFR